MDVHCTTCGEPWDTHHLWHDGIWETGLDEEKVAGWKGLPPEERLKERFRQAFKDAGFEFGQSVINVTRCPACPADAKPDQEKLLLKAEIEAMLAGDEDGLAAHYADLGL